MRRTDAHTHPCVRCQTAVDCGGDLSFNYDGEPETICEAYHQMGGTVARIVCDACAQLEAVQAVADALENV